MGFTRCIATIQRYCRCADTGCCVGISDIWDKRTLEDADGRREVVHAARSAESSGDDRGRRNEIVSEAVVQVSLFMSVLHPAIASWSSASRCRTHPLHRRITYLELEYIVHLVKLLLISAIKHARSAMQLYGSSMELNGSTPGRGFAIPYATASPLQGVSYLAVNSSNVSSAC